MGSWEPKGPAAEIYHGARRAQVLVLARPFSLREWLNGQANPDIKAVARSERSRWEKKRGGSTEVRASWPFAGPLPAKQLAGQKF